MAFNLRPPGLRKIFASLHWIEKCSSMRSYFEISFYLIPREG